LSTVQIVLCCGERTTEDFFLTRVQSRFDRYPPQSALAHEKMYSGRSNILEERDLLLPVNIQNGTSLTSNVDTLSVFEFSLSSKTSQNATAGTLPR
jgi:hypothetical protein